MTTVLVLMGIVTTGSFLVQLICYGNYNQAKKKI